MKIDLTVMEALRIAYALQTSLNSARQKCRDTDSVYGSLNHIYRDMISDIKSAGNKIVEELGPLLGIDFSDDPIDEHIQD